MAEPVIVTLDGPAGVGKSTLAKMLAGRLGLAYLDTGAMFRAVGFLLGPGSWDWPEPALRRSRLTLPRTGISPWRSSMSCWGA